MATSGKSTGHHSSEAQLRAERQAEQLRANLKRRKDQARARERVGLRSARDVAEQTEEQG